MNITVISIKMSCSVNSCKNNSRNNKSKILFSFPRNQLLREQWLKFVGKSDPLSSYWRVCEDHFNEEDVIGRLQCNLGIQRKIQLRVGAVPTIVNSSAGDTGDCSEVDISAAKDSYEDDDEAESLKQIQKLKSELSALQKEYDELERTVRSKELDLDTRKLELNRKPDCQSDEESTATESFEEGASCDTESTFNVAQTSVKLNKKLKWPGDEVMVQAEIESSEEEEYTKCQEEKKRKIAMQEKRPRIIWNLLTEEEAKPILRTRRERSYFCDQCGKHIFSTQGFKAHLLRHSGEKNFECQTCKKRFSTPLGLKMHDLVHTDIKRYNCRFCDMPFKCCHRRLKHERRSHTLERPYKCSYCEKAFLDNTQRKKHEPVHTNIRKYHCELCDMSFKTPFSLSQHKRSKRHKGREEKKNDK